MIDPKLSIAISNALIRLENERKVELHTNRFLTIKSKIERRIENGEQHDLVFAEETKSIHA